MCFLKTRLRPGECDPSIPVVHTHAHLFTTALDITDVNYEQGQVPPTSRQVTGIPPDAQEIRTNGELVTSLGPQPMVQTDVENGDLIRPKATVWTQQTGVFSNKVHYTTPGAIPTTQTDPPT